MNLPVILTLFFSMALTSSSTGDSDSSISSASSSFNSYSSSESDSTSNSSTSTSFSSSPQYEIFLPYRLDYLAEMKLTTIFPRKFLYTLRDYERSKNSGIPVLSLPNCPSGAMRLGAVELPLRKDMNSFLRMMEELSRRVYRTGFNKATAGGNFRLPIKGLAIDPATRLVYTSVDTDFPTDSHERYVKFIKSFYYRLARTNFRYNIDASIKLDQIVLGMVNNLADVDLKAFEKTFKNFQVGFLTMGKVIVRPPGRNGDSYKSIFYFDHVSYEPIIGIENTFENEENVNPNGVGVRSNNSTRSKSKKKSSSTTTTTSSSSTKSADRSIKPKMKFPVNSSSSSSKSKK